MLYIILIEQMIEGIKAKQWKQSLLAFAGIAATSIPHFIAREIYEFPYAKYGLSPETVWTIRDFAGSFVVSPLAAEYTILFVIMGILMYFAGNKYGKAAVLGLFGCLCYFGNNMEFLRNFFGSRTWLSPVLYDIRSAVYAPLQRRKGKRKQVLLLCVLSGAPVSDIGGGVYTKVGLASLSPFE